MLSPNQSLYENTIIKIPPIHSHSLLVRFDASAAGLSPGAARTGPSIVCRAEHQGRSGHRLLG